MPRCSWECSRRSATTPRSRPSATRCAFSSTRSWPNPPRLPSARVDDENGGAPEDAGPKVVEGAVRLGQRIAGDLGAHRHLRRQLEELLAVAAGQVGDG